MQSNDTGKYVLETKNASDFVEKRIAREESGFNPEVALTLGSGLGDLEELIEEVVRIPYAKIPHFPRLTVEGHKGELVAGYLEGVPVVGLSGRKHYYEVADRQDGMQQVVFPVHVAANLDCKLYFATNAAGGLNTDYSVGDLMLVTSHISLFFPNPLLGKHLNFGNNLYFQPMDKAYSEKLQELLMQASENYKQFIHQGVYIGLTGRTYETKAECLFLRQIGADAVGMSTVPEIIVATNRGLETMAVSIITNIVAEDGTNATTHEEVQAILQDSKVKQRIATIFHNFFNLFQASS